MSRQKEKLIDAYFKTETGCRRVQDVAKFKGITASDATIFYRCCLTEYGVDDLKKMLDTIKEKEEYQTRYLKSKRLKNDMERLATLVRCSQKMAKKYLTKYLHGMSPKDFESIRKRMIRLTKKGIA